MPVATLPAADTSSNPTEEEAMPGHTIPATCGRSVLIRTCVGSEAVQLGIVGKRGGLIEAVCFNATQLPGLLGGLEHAAEKAGREYARLAEDRTGDLLDRLVAAEAASNATHCPEGHELTPENTFGSGSRKRCRTCRRDDNAWTREGGRLKLKTSLDLSA
jgi:hypothetical protein